ncbi:Cytochrome P450 E-class group I [Penicillium expansum]|nr:Cytochrome P450 E-class group I [Penicillium expansum]
MVSTNSSSAIPAIYSANAPALKSAFYEAFAPGMPSSFTTNDKIYRQKKQILSAAFAPRKLEAMEPLIRLHIDTFCEKIASAGKVDIAVMLGALSIDVLSDLCFGKSFDTLNNEPERDRILEAMEKSVELVIREGTMHKWPRAIWKVLHSKEKVIKRGYVYQRAVEAMMQQMHSKSERDDFFTNILQARRPETGEPYDKRELMGEAILLLFVQTAHIPDSVISLLIKVVYSVAGSDTTSTALTVIIWHLLANPKTMEKLTAEICENFDSTDSIKYQALQGLPYLHAVIEEGLRICPPNPGLIPRVVVDRTPGHLAIDGRIFPPGTEIGVCNLSLHHNPLYFDQPDAFLPERWLQDSKIKCDKGAFSPFSYGPRSCLGRNMAYMEMSLTLALLVYRLKLSFANHDKERLAGFDVDDAFVAIKPAVPVTVARV